MHTNLELERAASRPADGLRRPIGEEDVGNEAERQTDDANATDESVEQQDVDDAARRPRHFAERKVQQGQHDHQNRDNQSDHS
jgi:hypothetical protein